jgi:hypothetical protein
MARFAVRKPLAAVIPSLRSITQIRSLQTFAASRQETAKQLAAYCASLFFWTLLFLMILVFLGLGAFSQSGNQPAPPKTPPKTPPTPVAKGVHDVISTTFSATCGDPDDSSKALEIPAIKPSLDLLAQQKELDWSSSELFKVAKRAVANTSATVDTDQAYVFHVDHWTSSHVLVSSDWFVYRGTKAGKLKFSGFTASGDQSLYGLKRALLVGIEIMDAGKSGSLKFDYKISAVQGTPENAQALGQLISALLGLATGSAQFAEEEGCSVLTGAAFQNGTKHLPFDLNVAESAYDSTKVKDSNTPKDPTQNASPGVADCSAIDKGTPCTLSRTFTSLDKEWWDVGIGVTIPGVRETKYSIVNSALKQTPTTHTDAYAFFDIYPFAEWLTKDSGVPHFAVGLPLTSQTFYRPFFGMSENLTGWNGFQRWSGLPSLNFFAGVVYMKTSIVTGSPTTQAELTSDQQSVRVTKVLFGIEVPVKSLISKVGKSKTKNSSGASAPTGSGQ